MVRRLVMCFGGMLVCALSVGFFKKAAFGVDPFQSLLAGLDQALPLSFGTISLLVNLGILIFTFFADKHYIGLGTLFNLFLSGYIIEYFTAFLNRLVPEMSLIGRIGFLILGIVVMCLAGAVYITADLGVSSYDSIALIITETWKKGKFKYVRILCDFICVALGVSLFFIGGGRWSSIGAVVGVGTIVTAFFMGPLIAFFRKHIAEPLLYGNGSDKA
ncbi:MAG: hypothetical protein IJL98_10290 [Lachnospiraceae bacterium]|nr:hypothetical protein [Lachnospiraceae bacterium]